jgi:hypothetical protein
MPGEKYLDVSQNIEFAIVEVYNADKSLIDMDAIKSKSDLVIVSLVIVSSESPRSQSL